MTDTVVSEIETSMDEGTQAVVHCHKMTDTVVSEFETSTDEGTQAVVPKPKPKARQSSSKPRAEARPYKKYDLLNLEGKITKMKKQAELQRSRLLLLEDKLQKHEREIAIRATQSTNNEENAD